MTKQQPLSLNRRHAAAVRVAWRVVGRDPSTWARARYHARRHWERSEARDARLELQYEIERAETAAGWDPNP